IILMSSTQLLTKIKERELIQTFGGQSIADETHCAELATAATFMAHFVPNQACSSSTKASAQTLLHWELVRKFLCHCTAVDFTDMHRFLDGYIDYFTKRATCENLILHLFNNKMCESGFRFRSSQEWNLEELRAKLREQMQRSRQSGRGLIREAKLEPVLKETVVKDSDRRLKKWRVLRERKLQPAREANAVENFLETSQYAWYMSPNFAPTFRIGDLTRDPWDLFSMFEESRINALVCFDHIFP
ncbi:hypothetical protein U1Q18_005254, partial [Sarracenia purpurea var. burkii]